MTFPSTIPVVTNHNLIGGAAAAAGPIYDLDTTNSDTTHKYYELRQASGSYGFEIRHESDNTTKIYVNSDDNNANPAGVTHDDTSISAQAVVLTSSATLVTLQNTVGDTAYYATFAVTSNMFFPSGPNVTSHTPSIVITNDTITSSDLSFLQDGSAYSPSSVTLVASNTIGTNNDTGYIYDFNKNDTGLYTTTIDSKAVTALYFDASWTFGSSASSGRSTNSNRILNVLATIPSNITIGTGSDLNGNPNPLTTVFSYNSRVIQHTMSATLNGVTGNIYINFVINNKVINGVSEIVATFYETRTIGTDYSFQNNSVDYIIGAQQTMTYSQSLLGDTIVYKVSDWVYSAEPEGDDYTAPVSTTSNGGGKPDRYPLIMTNLFNRNRSIYSIGMTHKDTWDLFE